MNVERIREMYPEGTQIILQEMQGENQMPYGLKGTVKFVDDAGQIHMSWENGSSLALNINEDTFEKVEAPENAMEQYNRIADAILTLDSFPDRFALFELEPEHSWGMRRMVVDNYLVCYMVDPGVVTVTDVLYGASNVHMRLQERHP